jgi:hypothetical protein
MLSSLHHRHLHLYLLNLDLMYLITFSSLIIFSPLDDLKPLKLSNLWLTCCALVHICEVA